MTFIWPVMLFSLVLVPLFAALYVVHQQRRRRAAALYSSLGFSQSTAGRSPGLRRHLPPALFLAGVTLLLVSLARPHALLSLPRVEGTVILAFDVSGSMAADDLKPTRMEAAKTTAREFIERQPATVRIGVVAFSDNGFSVQAPTSQQEEILAAVNRLTPQRGTSLANGIQAALKTIAIDAAGDVTIMEGEPRSYSLRTPEPTPSPTPVPKGNYSSAVIVLLTDGENNEDPDPFEAAQAASDRGVRIHTVGIGSPEGSLLKIEGFTIRTRLDQAMLEQISGLTGGKYYNAASEEDLRTIYENLDAQLVVKPERTEITALFAGASVIVLLAGGLLSLLWFGRLP